MTLLDRYRKWRGEKLRPGQKCPISGVYEGRFHNAEYSIGGVTEATCVRGEPMPPMPLPFGYWQIKDATNVNEADA